MMHGLPADTYGRLRNMARVIVGVDETLVEYFLRSAPVGRLCAEKRDGWEAISLTPVRVGEEWLYRVERESASTRETVEEARDDMRAAVIAELSRPGRRLVAGDVPGYSPPEPE